MEIECKWGSLLERKKKINEQAENWSLLSKCLFYFKKTHELWTADENFEKFMIDSNCIDGNFHTRIFKKKNCNFRLLWDEMTWKIWAKKYWFQNKLAINWL